MAEICGFGQMVNSAADKHEQVVVAVFDYGNGSSCSPTSGSKKYWLRSMVVAAGGGRVMVVAACVHSHNYDDGNCKPQTEGGGN